MRGAFRGVATGLLVACALLAAPGTAAAVLPGTWPSMAVAPDGRYVYAAGPFGLETYARDGASGALTRIDAVEASGNAVAVSPDGTTIYAVSGVSQPAGSLPGPTGMVLVFHRQADGSLLQRQAVMPGLTEVTTLLVSPDGRFVYATGFRSDAIAVYRRSPDGTLALQSRLEGRGSDTLTMSPDGRFVYIGEDRMRRDAADGGLTPIAAEGVATGSLGHFAFAPDGLRAYNGFGSVIRTLTRDAESGATTRRAEWTGPGSSIDFGGLALAPDGVHLASALSQTGALRLYRTADDAAVQLVDERVGGNYGDRTVGYPVTLAWAPDGRSLYVGSEYGRMSVWSLAPESDRLVAIQALPWDGRTPAWSAPAGASVAIAGGAPWINNEATQVVVGNPTANTLQISDRPDFRGAPLQRARRDGVYRWRLRNAGTAPGRRSIYVRYVSSLATPRLGATDAVTQNAMDTVGIDRRRPVIARARLTRRPRGRSLLRLRARDNRSGVALVQTAKVRSRPSKPRKAAARLSLRGRPRALWVRVIDRAGNRSRWKRVRLR